MNLLQVVCDVLRKYPNSGAIIGNVVQAIAGSLDELLDSDIELSFYMNLGLSDIEYSEVMSTVIEEVCVHEIPKNCRV